MVRDDDEDALSWGGEVIDHVDARPTSGQGQGLEQATDAAPGAGSLLLIAYGILAGMYLLSAVGWIVTVTRSTISQSGLLAEIMYQLGEFLAIASPLVWFGTVLLMTRDARPVWRVLWLLIGLVAVAPWPFIVGGAL